MNVIERAPTVLPYAFTAMIVVIGLIFLMKRFYQKFFSSIKVVDLPIPESHQQEINVEEPHWLKCVCGAEATHPMPKLVRNRTGWWRSHFATAPTYKRVIDSNSASMLCESHAHMADSMMDRFIFERIRAIQAEANEKISIESSDFEREGLFDKIKETLEPKNTKKLSEAPKQSLRLLNTGTNN